MTGENRELWSKNFFIVLTRQRLSIFNYSKCTLKNCLSFLNVANCLLQVQLLAQFLNEQNQKQACLKKKRCEKPKVQTVEASVQCESSVVSKTQTADASVQTDHYHVVKELKEQIQNLTEVVRQLTAVKRIDQQDQKTPISPFFEDDLDSAMDIISSFRRDPTPRPPQESASTLPPSRPIQTQVQTNDHEELSPVYLSPVTPQPRLPLTMVDQNIPQLLSNYGPSDEQRRKVGAIVDLGDDLSTTALACVDVLFTDDEMAKGNMSGTKGFKQLDSTKMQFLISILQKKFVSTSFSKEWPDIAARINTKCRGKRRTLIQRLKKQTFF